MHRFSPPTASIGAYRSQASWPSSARTADTERVARVTHATSTIRFRSFIKLSERKFNMGAKLGRSVLRPYTIENGDTLCCWHSVAELWHSDGAEIFRFTGARYAPEDSVQ